jgi:hypothetical protein
MRWLLIAFLVSVAALLVAAAGAARHIWLHRAKLHSNPDARAASSLAPANQSDFGRVEETDREL